MSWLILAVSIIPGLGLTRVLDGSADRTRRVLLAPALGLLLIFGTAGLISLAGFSFIVLDLAILLLNVVGIYILRQNNDEILEMSPWQKLEASMSGEITISESLEGEVASQRFFQENRSALLLPAVVVSLLLALLPLILFKRPMGVDWIGFTVLTETLLQTGSFELPSPSTGWWTYPPAFPMLAAWNSHHTGAESLDSIMVLGQMTFAALLMGIAGATDRHGSGTQTLIAIGLSAGLFAKIHDSGWPTISSQLGLVVGLLVLLRPSATRGKHHTIGFVIAAFSVAVIHPTGLVYLGTMMLAHIIIGYSIEGGEGWNRLLSISAIIFTSMAAISLVFIAPRLASDAVFAEYGWQGGAPLVMYSGFLLPFAVWASWKLKETVEGRILILWLALNWLLTMVHLVDGLQKIPALTMLSYTLYSMGLHAFHIPLAAILGLWWSDSTALTEIEKGNDFLMQGKDPHCSKKVAFSMLAIVVLQIGGAMFALNSLSEHDELYAKSEGDLAIQNMLGQLPSGSIVYNENAHWGHTWNVPEGIGITAVPTLGLLHQTESIQNKATNAIQRNEISTLNELGVTHAITSPMGTMGWVIASSPWWSIIHDQDGARLWELRSELEPFSESAFYPVVGDEMRKDPWKDYRFRDPWNLGEQRLHLYQGVHTVQLETNDWQNVCFVAEIVGDIEATFAGKNINKSGWTQTCVTGGSDSFIIEVKDNPSYWINPLGLSGRGDQIIDQTGLRIHWIETRSLNQ